MQKLDEFINCIVFESPLNEVFTRDNKNISKGGRPPFSPLMMFKALIVKSLYNLSDDQLVFLPMRGRWLMLALGRLHATAIPERKTSVSKKPAQHQKNGARSPARSVRKMWMPDGQRKTVPRSMGTRTILNRIPRQS
ncbi:MAG: transposase [Tenuifilaceae bacterium]|nr:transposase [Tenuifilaceae bacterium]